jgi:hypothetical protein
LLLELPLEPPESDPEVIENTIRKKQSEWSRYRNHPTRGLEAKHYIDLIPEIRKVMGSETSRQEEAQNALKILQQEEQNRYSDMDRHIRIYLSKGYMTEEEISRLSQQHAIDEQQVRKRLDIIKQNQLVQIDQALSQRMKKGFVTIRDIEELAERFSVKPDEIQQRVTCPINHNGLKTIEKTKNLDPTIEKNINENLKIVGKSSLYEFLDLPENTDLKTLQERSREKKADIQKSMRKDAVVTASSALIGHCNAIFESGKSRLSYDMSRIRSCLTKLDADIDMAAMDGKIRAEYIDTLLERAVDFGMTHEEAKEYLQAYCRKKNWQIEGPPQNLKKVPSFKVMIISLLVFCLVSGAGGFYIWKVHRPEMEYMSVIQKVEEQSDLSEKLKILYHYLNTHDSSGYSEKLKSRIQTIQKQMDEAVFEKKMAFIRNVVHQEDFQKALDLYDEMLEVDVWRMYVPKIKEAKFRVLKRIEEQEYDHLLNEVAINETPDVKLAAFQEFLQSYPGGDYAKAVQDLIKEMRNEYYLFIEKKIADYQTLRDWQQCVLYCDQFIHTYPNDKRTQILRNVRLTFKEKSHYQKIIQNLRQKAAAFKNNRIAARQVYVDYVKAYPDTMIKEEVRQEIDKLDARIQAQKRNAIKDNIRNSLQPFAGRFVEKKDGVVTDEHTGLMWCLLDSMTEKETCLTYDDAIAYVQALRTGGYHDWRLPTLAELQALYRKSPAFPVTSSVPWYWTSETYAFYDQGWSKLIDVLIFNDTRWENKKKKIWECGAVRAVRP